MSLKENWTLLSDYAHKTIQMLEKKNVKHAEAFFTSTKTIEVAIRNSEILTQNMIDDSGVGLRVVTSGNKVGFACTNALNKKTIMETGEKALAIAKASSPTPDFALPATTKIPKVERLFDPHVVEATVEEAVDFAKRAIAAAEAIDNRVGVKYGRVMFQHGWRGVSNSLGVDLEEQETKAIIILGGSGEENGEVTGSCFDLMLKRTLSLNPEKIGENVGRVVVEQFKPRTLKSFQGTVIFGPEAVSYQPFDVLTDALNGENVVSKRSTWTGKQEQRVASESLTVIDGAVLGEGFASRSFDDEGCASQNTLLIKKGKLQSFLHNATSANVLNAKNTGNASRNKGGFDMIKMIIGKGYRTKPEIYPSNLIIQKGNKTKEELVSETDKGVLIESMAGFAQAGSGLISAQLSRAFYIRDGEIQYPIKGGMVSGTAFDWFQNVSDIGKDSKQFQNAIVPSIRVENVKVIGA